MRILKLIFIFLPLLALGKVNPPALPSGNRIELYINLFTQIEHDARHAGTSSDVERLIKKLERKENQVSDATFLRFLFSKTHAQFLRHFNEFASFSETLTKGKYNCLTGTALYAMLLDHFDIEYKIIETNYHIFLVATTAQGKFLFEATDPHGFVDNEEAIEKRIRTYKENRMAEAVADKKFYRYNFELFNEVTLDQMAGLLSYNQAVKAYNDRNLASSIFLLQNAQELYSSPRISEFSTILLLSVLEASLDKATKADYLKNIQAIRRKQLPIMARH
jgi:hypothetical protein